MEFINEEFSISFNQTFRTIRYLIDVDSIEKISVVSIVEVVKNTAIDDNTIICFYTEVYGLDYFEQKNRVCIYINYSNMLYDVSISAPESVQIKYFENLENLKIDLIMELLDD